MEKLLNHIFFLIKENKLKNGKYNDILLDVVWKSIIKCKILWNKFDFKFYKEESNKTFLKK